MINSAYNIIYLYLYADLRFIYPHTKVEFTAKIVLRLDLLICSIVIPFETGVNEPMFEIVRQKLSIMPEIYRNVNLLFDEIALESTLHYNLKKDWISNWGMSV